MAKATRGDWARFHNVIVGVRQKIHNMREARRRPGEISTEPLPDFSRKVEPAPKVEIEDRSEVIESVPEVEVKDNSRKVESVPEVEIEDRSEVVESVPEVEIEDRSEVVETPNSKE